MEEPGGPQSMGSLRVGQDSVNISTLLAEIQNRSHVGGLECIKTSIYWEKELQSQIKFLCSFRNYLVMKGLIIIYKNKRVEITQRRKRK